MKLIIRDGNGAEELDVRDSRCPHCGSADIRRSKPAGLLDAIWASFGRLPLRCRSCRHRFHVRSEAIRYSSL